MRSPAPSTLRATPDTLHNLRRLSGLLDRAFILPGTRIRFGLDGLIGLVPGVGDVATGILSAWIIVAAARLGAPAPVLGRMVLNLLVDVGIGLVPLVGDLFDFAWKANLRNVALLERHLAEPERARRMSGRVLAGVAFALLLLLGLATWSAFLLASALLGMLG